MSSNPSLSPDDPKANLGILLLIMVAGNTAPKVSWEAYKSNMLKSATKYETQKGYTLHTQCKLKIFQRILEIEDQTKGGSHS